MKSFGFFILLQVVVFSLLVLGVVGKECTNSPTPLSSKTVRYQLMTSTNETWKKEVFSYYDRYARKDDYDASKKLLLKKENEFSWKMLNRQAKSLAAVKGPNPGSILHEVSLHDVRIDPNSMFGIAQKTNMEYLLMLDPDNLVWSFRKTAGLPTIGTPYGGWESPTSELRGHFVGHYLSATAKAWASSHNETLKKKMSSVVSALLDCQKKIGTGYLSAFPSTEFDSFEAVQPVWAPYYTIHKILAGLLDQHMFAGNPNALRMTTWMVHYFYKRVQNVIATFSIERHWLSINDETGGMNDVLYKLYTVTGDRKHLLLAHLFDKPCFLGLLALKADSLSDFHANTHIPIVVGALRRYEITADPIYKEMGLFFMDIVNSSHIYATGGTSENEHWTDPMRLGTTLTTENEESCATYNMLKVARHLFRWTKKISYAEYYERALTNGVLSIQRGTDPGVMIYMLPLIPGGSKAVSTHGWGTKYNDFWCCMGTGIESFAKLGDSIYFEEQTKVPRLYIIQYVSSSFNWKIGQILVKQHVKPVASWFNSFQVAVSICPAQQGADIQSTISLRIPSWTDLKGAKASVNGKDLSIPSPGNFLTITRSWTDCQSINLELPILLRTEPIKDERPEYALTQAVLYGPYLLAGLTYGDGEIRRGPANQSDWITPVPENFNSYLITLSQNSGDTPFGMTMNNDSLLIMDNFPAPGTNVSLNATFRIVLDDALAQYAGPADAVGKLVSLEPISFPGMVVVPHGKDQVLGLGHQHAASDKHKHAAVFRMVSGLDGSDQTVSLESTRQKGCFVYSGVRSQSGVLVTLNCNVGSNDGLKSGASFVMQPGISSYHRISFVARGVRRNFLMVPLLSLRDENYNVYFNMTM